jgi:hypothetical protein
LQQHHHLVLLQKLHHLERSRNRVTLPPRHDGALVVQRRAHTRAEAIRKTIDGERRRACTKAPQAHRTETLIRVCKCIAIRTPEVQNIT